MTWIPVDRDSLKSSEMYSFLCKLWCFNPLIYKILTYYQFQNFDLRDLRSISAHIIWSHTQKRVRNLSLQLFKLMGNKPSNIVFWRWKYLLKFSKLYLQTISFKYLKRILQKTLSIMDALQKIPSRTRVQNVLNTLIEWLTYYFYSF